MRYFTIVLISVPHQFNAQLSLLKREGGGWYGVAMVEIEKSAEDKKEQQPRSVTFVDILAWAYIVITGTQFLLIFFIILFPGAFTWPSAVVLVVDALLIVVLLGTFGKTARIGATILITVLLLVAMTEIILKS